MGAPTTSECHRPECPHQPPDHADPLLWRVHQMNDRPWKLEVLVKLATRGFWHAIISDFRTPKISPCRSLTARATTRPRDRVCSWSTLFLFAQFGSRIQLVSIRLRGPGGGSPPGRYPSIKSSRCQVERLELIQDLTRTDPAVRSRVAELIVQRSGPSSSCSSTATIRTMVSGAVSEMHGSTCQAPAGQVAFHDLDYGQRCSRRFSDQVKVGGVSKSLRRPQPELRYRIDLQLSH